MIKIPIISYIKKVKIYSNKNLTVAIKNLTKNIKIDIK